MVRRHLAVWLGWSVRRRHEAPSDSSQSDNIYRNSLAVNPGGWPALDKVVKACPCKALPHWAAWSIITVGQDDRWLVAEILEKLARLSEAFVLWVVRRRPLEVCIHKGEITKPDNLRDMAGVVAKFNRSIFIDSNIGAY